MTRTFTTTNYCTIYRELVGDANLYGRAFFGHSTRDPKRNKNERAKLSRLWTKALRIAKANGNEHLIENNIPA
jgi:hypothetical protein